MPEAVATKSEQGAKPQGKTRGTAEPQSRGHGSASRYGGVMALHRTAGNRAVASLMDPAAEQAFVPPIVADAIHSPGQPLDRDTREYMETRFGHDFGQVRIHADAGAAASSDAMGASAYTVGRHIVLGAGQYDPESASGKRLLAHELAHTIQQESSLATTGAEGALESQAQNAGDKALQGSVPPVFGSGPVAIQRQAKPGETHLEQAYTTIVFGARPTAMKEDLPTEEDAHGILLKLHAIDAQGLAESEVTQLPDGWAFSHPDVGQYAIVEIVSMLVGGATKYALQGSASKIVRVRTTAGKPGPLPDVDSGPTDETETQAKPGAKTPGADPTKPDSRGKGDTTSTQKKEEKNPDGSPKQTPLTEEEQKRFDALRALMSGGGPKAQEDPRELLRLYQELLDSVENITLSKGKGDPWTNFAKFLAKNKDKIEGRLSTGPDGLDQKQLEKIIADYGKFIVAQPAEEPEQLEKLEDYDKHFEYNPNWQKMSPADRKLLLDYAKMTPDELEKTPIDFSVVTTDMKISIALKLAKSWPSAVADAAANAFTDPKFVITLIVTIGIYVGLWLTPDPTWITKIAAGTLTAVMLIQFAWSDIYGTATAWMDLETACKSAKTVEELKKAGDDFAKQIGAVGFDILLFIAMWGLGKLAGPKLSKIGAKRGVARAEAGVKAAEGEPGSGVQQPTTAEGAKILERAARPTASATLDALADLLPDEAAKNGLKQLRGIKGGDMQALRALKAELAKGTDLARFLSEKAQTPEVRAKAQANLLQAKGKLARAKLIEAETIKDPALREAVRTEQLNAIQEILQKAGILNDPKIQNAIKGGNVSQLVGELGEAIQRTQMRAKYPASQGYSVLSNVEVVQQVPGFDSIAKWQAAEKAAGRTGDPGGLYEKGGQLWKSLGNADSLVAKAGNGGKLQPVEIEEVKTGENDSPTKASRQVAKVTTGLGQIAAGQKGIRIFDRVGKNEIGTDLTDKFDLSEITQVKTSTRGPEGRGFAQSLGFDTATLNLLAESLIKNLPPANLPTIPPLVSPREKKEEEKEQDKEELVPAGR